jgi:hypothetical protein
MRRVVPAKETNMKLSRLLAVACAIIGLAGTMPQAQAQPGRGDRWERLGCVDVGRRPDFDIIQVGRREGRFRAVMLEVSGNDVFVDQLRVIYANGQPDTLAVRADLREGMRTRPLDLQGWQRSIDRIEIMARRNVHGPGHGRAQICVMGLAAGGPAMPPPVHGGRWEQLGCQQVQMMRDRDSIHVSRRDGQYRAVRLEVRGSDIQLEQLVVVYGNGEADRIPTPGYLRQGSMTPPLDLRGDRRFIQRVDMVYRAIPNFRGQAWVCVSGLH